MPFGWIGRVRDWWHARRGRWATRLKRAARLLLAFGVVAAIWVHFRPQPEDPPEQVAPGPTTTTPRPVDPPDQATTTVPSRARGTVDAPPPMEVWADGAIELDRTSTRVEPPEVPAIRRPPVEPSEAVVERATATAARGLGSIATVQPVPAEGQTMAVSRMPATELARAMAAAGVSTPEAADPVALLAALPGGVQQITYRLCAESARQAARCTVPMPIGVAGAIDVTGDGSLDLVADLLPTVSVASVVARVHELASADAQLADVRARLASSLELLTRPLSVLRRPHLAVDAARVQREATAREADRNGARDALRGLLNLGLGLLQLRLPTSEHAGAALAAHMWVLYDLPGEKRVSVGLDGFRRGAGLPRGMFAAVTIDTLAAIDGVLDVLAVVRQHGAPSALAITAGLAAAGDATPPDQIMTSTRFAPVPTTFELHALLAPDGNAGSLAMVSDRQAVVDTVILQTVAERAIDRMMRFVADELPLTFRVAFTRTRDGGRTALDYTASSTVGSVAAAYNEYVGGALQRTGRVAIERLPAVLSVVLETDGPAIGLDYSARSRVDTLAVALYDRAAAVAAVGALHGLPTHVRATYANEVHVTADQPLGAIEFAASRAGGAVAILDGEHAAVVADGDRFGVSLRLSGLRSLDLSAPDGRFLVRTALDPGGQPFTAAVDVAGVRGLVELSNLPALVSVALDQGARTARYMASAPINRVTAGIDAPGLGAVHMAVDGVPSIIDASWDLDPPALRYNTSRPVPRVDLATTVGPAALAVSLLDLPATIELAVDLGKGHIEGALSGSLTSVRTRARVPVDGKPVDLDATLEGVPSHFDADFDLDRKRFRFRGLSGPIRLVQARVTNHGDVSAPTGEHVAVHLRPRSSQFDASVAVRNLSSVAVATDDAGTTTVDLGVAPAGPVLLDLDLPFGNATNAAVAATGRLVGLPNVMRLARDGENVRLSVERPLAIDAVARIGDAALLRGLGAPFVENGFGISARCAPSGGCKRFGAVIAMRLARLPDAVAVQLSNGTVAVEGYRAPPGVPFRVFARLLDVVQGVPRLEALAELSGLPDQLDSTIGPLARGDTGAFDMSYAASAAIGSLTIDLDADTAAQGRLRARGRVSPVPASLHISGAVTDQTGIALVAPTPIDELTLAIAAPEKAGTLLATARGIPRGFTVTVDDGGVTWDASSAVESLTLRGANLPYDDHRWNVFAELTGIPAEFGVSWSNAPFAVRFEKASAPIRTAAIAVANHAEATGLDGPHVAFHLNEALGTFDASVLVEGLRALAVEAGEPGERIAGSFDITSESVGVDIDVVRADEFRVALAGTVTGLPGTVTFGREGDKVTVASANPLGVNVDVRLGKVATVGGGAPDVGTNGIAVRVRGCRDGPGCANATGPLCVSGGTCLGVVGSVDIASLPTSIVVDTAARSFTFRGYQGAPDLQAALDVADVGGSTATINATLSGIRAMSDFSVASDTGADADGVLHVGWKGAPISGLLVTASGTAAGFAGLGHVEVQGVPSRVDLKVDRRSGTIIDYEASALVERIAAAATLDLTLSSFPVGRASFRTVLEDLPTRLHLEVDNKDASGVRLPTLVYDASHSTLDGSIDVVDVTLPTVGLLTGVASASVSWDDLGQRTEVCLGGRRDIGIVSEPLTGLLVLKGSVDLVVDTEARPTQPPPTPGQPARAIVPPCLLRTSPSKPSPSSMSDAGTGASAGAAAPSCPDPRPAVPTAVASTTGGGTPGPAKAPQKRLDARHSFHATIHVGELSIAVSCLRSIDIRPNSTFTGLRVSNSALGGYGGLTLDLADVKVVPKYLLHLTARIGKAKLPAIPVPLNFDTPFTAVDFRVAQRGSEEVEFDVQKILRDLGLPAPPIPCLAVSLTRERIEPRANHAEVDGGEGGVQQVSYIPSPLSPIRRTALRIVRNVSSVVDDHRLLVGDFGLRLC